MNPIESLSARFVDDLLRLLSGASIEELMALAATGGATNGAAKARKARPAPLPPVVTAERRKAPPAAPVRRLTVRAASGGATAASPRSPTVEEITDPEKLLAITTPAPASTSRAPARTPKASASRLIAEVPAEPPSGVRPAAPRVLVQLKGNETVARASSSGIVIRRRKTV